MSFSFRFLVYPFLWLISILPFPVLYAFSDFIAFLLYKVVGYRKGIVKANLERSFPQYSAEKRLEIERKFYRHLADLMLETIKGMSIGADSLKKRMKLVNKSALDEMYAQRRSCIVVMSHCGNWEWVCDVAQISIQQHAQCVYKTLHNKSWDQWFYEVRSRFGTDPFPMEKTLRIMSGQSNEVTATAFIGDQNPSSGKSAFWTRFLNQDTCFMQGSEKIARKFNQPVLYMAIHKKGRGWYECEMEMICENPAETKPGEVTELIARAIEKDIQSQPENWLWSHRRWKHKKEEISL